MDDSILKTTKKILGLDAEYTAFDLDVITHINATLGILHDLGIGDKQAFMVTGVDETWADFEPDQVQRNSVKTYVFLRVKLAFDPPQTSFHLQAINEQIKELEWRLSARRENAEWTPE